MATAKVDADRVAAYLITHLLDNKVVAAVSDINADTDANGVVTLSFTPTGFSLIGNTNLHDSNIGDTILT